MFHHLTPQLELLIRIHHHRLPADGEKSMGTGLFRESISYFTVLQYVFGDFL